MKAIWSGAAAAVLCLAPVAMAAAPLEKPQPFEVPYRLTVPKHILVRAKLNGKGPFNFILDTGAPALFVATKVCDKLGVKPDKNGWGVFDKVEIEGGVTLTRPRGRIEDPFQLEGMNGLGLAGAELHGVIGYNILARYRMEIDFTRDKMLWTPLDFEPKGPMGLGGKGGGAGGLEAIGSIMKMLGQFMGSRANPEVVFRAFLGVELAEKGEDVHVKSVLASGPAGSSGLKAGDQLTKFQGRTILNIEDVQRLARKVRPGDLITLTILRGGKSEEVSFKSGEGL